MLYNIYIVTSSPDVFTSTYNPELDKEIRRFGVDPSPDTLKRDLRVVDSVIRHGSQEAYYIAGALCEEIAFRDCTPARDRTRFIDYSEEMWATATDKWWYREDVASWTLRSASNLACVGLSRYIAEEATLPPEEDQQHIYDNLLNVALRAAQLQTLRTEQKIAQEARDVTGIVAELAIALLHNRFSLTELGGSQVAKPSTITEDRGSSITKDNITTLTGWDLSVYEESPPDPAGIVYKVQVKSRKQKGVTYAPEIIVVNLSEDLAVSKKETKKGTLRPYKLVDELERDRHNPEPGLTARLTERTDKYLEILG